MLKFVRLFMKKLFFFAFLFCFSIIVCPAQKIIPAEKTTETKPVSAPSETEISDREWQIIIDSLRVEDWNKAAFFSSQLLSRLKTDNDKKQIAQLRYIYLFSLAGKIINYSLENKKEAEEATRNDLRKAAEDFAGKELLMPARPFLGDCKQVLNYICGVKNNENALRVTATNKEGTAIHSFDYVLFDQKIDLNEFTGKEAFLGGILKKVEFNEEKSNVWIIRLFLEKGFARVVIGK